MRKDRVVNTARANLIDTLGLLVDDARHAYTGELRNFNKYEQYRVDDWTKVRDVIQQLGVQAGQVAVESMDPMVSTENYKQAVAAESEASKVASKTRPRRETIRYLLKDPYSAYGVEVSSWRKELMPDGHTSLLETLFEEVNQEDLTATKNCEERTKSRMRFARKGTVMERLQAEYGVERCKVAKAAETEALEMLNALPYVVHLRAHFNAARKERDIRRAEALNNIRTVIEEVLETIRALDDGPAD